MGEIVQQKGTSCIPLNGSVFPVPHARTSLATPRSQPQCSEPPLRNWKTPYLTKQWKIREYFNYMHPKRRFWEIRRSDWRVFSKHFSTASRPNRVLTHTFVQCLSHDSWLKHWTNVCSPNEDFGTTKKDSGKTFCKHFSYSRLLYLGEK